jgi:tetratricopeptide (TPR) repeat protein
VQGSYVTATRALERAVLLYPDYFQAHARLAEASAELDDPSGASDRLLLVANLVPDEGRLPTAERLRLQALRFLVLRQLDESIAIYEQLARRSPEDPGAWMDLGRAQEAAGLSADARTSYQRAIEQDREHAVAYLRLGYVEGLEYRRDAALRAFAEAERLYAAASDVEGETEVLLRRGAMLDAFTELKQARADLDRALSLTEASQIGHQRVRATLTLSSVLASEGNFEQAERLAASAVQDARAEGLYVIAAEGLVELAATLAQAERLEDAEQEAAHALQLALQQDAQRTAARARVQLAVIRQKQVRAPEALAILDEALPYIRKNRYWRFEFYARLVAARAYEQLDALEQAHDSLKEVLAIAERLRDEAQVGLALSSLATTLAGLGRYPEAAQLRERAETIARRQDDKAVLPFHLVNRAEVLVVLGRTDDAERLLAELDEGIQAGVGSYAGRARRAAYIRGLAAAVALRCPEAIRIVKGLGAPTSDADSAGVLGAGVLAFCEAHIGARHAAPSHTSASAVPTLARERQYWLALAALERQDAKTALEEVMRGFSLLGDLPNAELRWRLALVGSAASRVARDEGRLSDMKGRWSDAEQTLVAQWGTEFALFTKRPDLVHVLTLAGNP